MATTSKYVTPSFGLSLIALQRSKDKALIWRKTRNKVNLFLPQGFGVAWGRAESNIIYQSS